MDETLGDVGRVRVEELAMVPIVDRLSPVTTGRFPMMVLAEAKLDDVDAEGLLEVVVPR